MNDSAMDAIRKALHEELCVVHHRTAPRCEAATLVALAARHVTQWKTKP